MPPEHIDIEAEWLAGELKRATGYARTAYETEESKVRQLYLANLIGTLDTLYNHYRPLDMDPALDPDGEAVKPQYAPAPRHAQRGRVARFFLGGN